MKVLIGVDPHKTSVAAVDEFAGGLVDEDAQRQVSSVISSGVSKLLDQYSTLPEPAHPGAAGEQPLQGKLSFVGRKFLLYTPHTVAGWTLHTMFYVGSLFFVTLCVASLSL